MLFQPISKAKKLKRKLSMGTAPVKSQPLHNFSLPFLKWGKNQMNNRRCRKLLNSSRESPSLDRRSSASEAESDGGSQKELESKNPSGFGKGKNRLPLSDCSSTSPMVNPQKNPTVSELDTRAEEVRSNLLIRLRTGSKDENVSKNKSAVLVTHEGERGRKIDESVPKPWNLRPRRAVVKDRNEFGGASRIVELQEKEENLPKSLRLIGFAEAYNVEKKEKRKFSISLSREEIEDDFFVLTGSKPSRRPKKRVKNIQKQVDNVFPGLWLAGITVDSYCVPDISSKT